VTAIVCNTIIQFTSRTTVKLKIAAISPKIVLSGDEDAQLQRKSGDMFTI